MTHLAFAIDAGGGNLTYQRNLAAALKAVEGVESDFLEIPIVQHDIWEMVPVLGRNLALTASARAAAALHAAERQSRLDAALIHSQSLALFAIPLMQRVPTVISTDGTPANYDSFADALDHQVYGPAIEGAKKLWTKATFGAAARVLGFSQWVKESLINDYRVPIEKIAVIPPGIDVERWVPAPARGLAPPEMSGSAPARGLAPPEMSGSAPARGLAPPETSGPRAGGAAPPEPPGPLRILFTGGNFERKGGPELLRWKRESRYGGDVELHLVTQRPVPPTPGVVVHSQLTPNAPELVTLVQSCDLFVLPTRGDCFGFAVIEAQAAGLPVVVSNVGGIRDIVLDGETGFLVGRGDFEMLRERIDRLVADPALRRSMGSAGRARAVEHFDARRNSRRVLDLLLGIAAGPERPQP